VTIEQAVLEHVLASGPVAAIVGTRGYQLILPQKPTLPALRVQLISEIERLRLDGELTNLFWARVQVDLWTNTRDNGDGYALAREGGIAIRNALALRSAGGQSFSSGGSPGELEVTSVEPLDKAIDYEAGELRQIRARQDFGVMFRELS
jgi:hypothetical protein